MTRRCRCWPNTWSGSRERCPGTGGWPNSIGSTAGTRTPARVWSGSSSSILCDRDSHAHLEMALALEAKGDIEGAVEHLRSALAVWENADRDYEPAREARRKLAELGG